MIAATTVDMVARCVVVGVVEVVVVARAAQKRGVCDVLSRAAAAVSSSHPLPEEEDEAAADVAVVVVDVFFKNRLPCTDSNSDTMSAVMRILSCLDAAAAVLYI